jgi:hypothetical protein
MNINPDYFFLQSIIGLFLLLPFTCQTKLAKPNPCMYISNSDHFFCCSPSLAFSCCYPTPNKQNPSMYINSDYFLIAVHHWPVPAAALHLPNQTIPRVLALTGTNSEVCGFA